MKNICNCLICNKPFKNCGKDICSDCRNIEQELLEKAVKHMKFKQNITVNQMSEELGISVNILNRFVREGKLRIQIKCHKCGIGIHHSENTNLCYKCKKSISLRIFSLAKRD